MKKKYCSYHNALSSSWENPKGVGDEVDNAECDWCRDSRKLIDDNGGYENFWENISKKFIESLHGKKKS